MGSQIRIGNNAWETNGFRNCLECMCKLVLSDVISSYILFCKPAPDLSMLVTLLLFYYLCSLDIFLIRSKCVRCHLYKRDLDFLSRMYTFGGIINNKDGISGGWAISHFMSIELGFFPMRATVRISDLWNERDWLLDNIFLDPR